MISSEEFDLFVKKTIEAFTQAGIVLTQKEKERIEVTDFGLGDIKKIGLNILTYVNTERVCAKEMYLIPFQTCPEHMHIDVSALDGKEETFRCRRGKVYLYVPGGDLKNIKAVLPKTKITAFKEIELNEGDQYTLYPNTLHWFQAGKDGAIISEFSTKSSDETDVFTDKRIIRIPKIKEIKC